MQGKHTENCHRQNLETHMIVCGMDPSLRNWGISRGVWDTDKLRIDYVNVCSPVLPTGKQVRQNSLDLESAKQLFKFALESTKGADAVFVEVPVGSQSARAMAGYAICVGILGALRATGIPLFEVTPNEVKLTTVGKKTATKQEMIEWAMNAHPEANWPTYNRLGKLQVSEAKAEHMADAIASIYAGCETNEFQQLIQILKANHANYSQAT